MKLSARSRYAARILLELARHNGSAPMSAATLSQHTGVSVQFVEQILKPLKQSGLTRSIRGAAGGHKLARVAESITLGEVVRLMEGGILLTVCCGEKANTCTRKEGCLTRKVWVQISQSLESELDAISLASLLHEEQVCPEAYPGEKRQKGAGKRARASAAVPVEDKSVPTPRPAKTFRKVKGLRR